MTTFFFLLPIHNTTATITSNRTGTAMLIKMMNVVSDDLLSSDFSFPASFFLSALVAAFVGAALRGVVEFS